MTQPWLQYPLIDALRSRRARRFGRGMRIAGGPLEYHSAHPPQPLTEEEQAILVFAGGGVNGPALNDWNWAPGEGGNVMAGLVGRTVSSSDAIQSVALVVIDDERTYLQRRPADFSREEVVELVKLARAGEFTEIWRRSRVPIADRRCAPPVGSPYNLTGNRWSLHAAGSTYFLLVSDVTYLFINILLEMFNEEMAIFALDERRLYLPAGLGRFARSRGGHLDDDPRALKAFPIEYGERLLAETVAVEQGMILQNLGLTCQALGLGGFPHFTGHDTAWFEALGFRMAQLPVSAYFAVPRLTRWALKLRGQDVPVGYPVGLEREGEVLLRPYCPPYYPSMEAAVLAVVERKFGAEGVYRGGVHAGAWVDPERVAAGITPISDAAIRATVACCEYLHRRYGRFPVYVPPYHTFMGFQAAHLDTDFYDTFYRPEVLTPAHRDHQAVWHAG